LVKEVEALGELDAFATYDVSKYRNVESWKVSTLKASIRRIAPSIYATLDILYRLRETYIEMPFNRLYGILSIIYYTRHPRLYDYL